MAVRTTVLSFMLLLINMFRLYVRTVNNMILCCTNCYKYEWDVYSRLEMAAMLKMFLLIGLLSLYAGYN